RAGRERLPARSGAPAYAAARRHAARSRTRSGAGERARRFGAPPSRAARGARRSEADGVRARRARGAQRAGDRGSARREREHGVRATASGARSFRRGVSPSSRARAEEFSMSPETRAFLESVRGEEDPAPGDESRIFARVEAALAAGAVVAASAGA